MALTKVAPALFGTGNNITSVTVGGSANTISLTFDGSGVITSATNNAVSVANTAITGNIISSQITSVANTQITGNIASSQITSNPTLYGNVSVVGTASINAADAIMTIGDNRRTVSTSVTTGAIVCGGGLGIWSSVYVGGSINLNGSTNGTATIAASAVAGTPTITLPTTTGTVALTSQLFGVSQTVQDVGASRTLGVTYTNSTGRPIAVYVSMSNASASAIVVLNINGAGFYGSSDPTANAYYGVTLMVPTGMTYSITMNGTPTLVTWIEIR